MNQKFPSAKICERALCAALLTFGAWSLAGCETGGKTMSAADAIRAGQQHDADIRTEANAPGLSARDEGRIVAAKSAIAGREQHELAEYAKFQFQQRLELAEASAPKIYVSMDGNTVRDTSGKIGSELKGTGITLSGHSSRERERGSTASNSNASSDRLYARGAMEDSVDGMIMDSAQREEESDAKESGGAAGTAPFGEPVAGKPGYVTSPQSAPSGYIDVRGYQSGSEVVDPYTGRAIRVP